MFYCKKKRELISLLFVYSALSYISELGNLQAMISKYESKIKKLGLKFDKCKSKDEFYRLKAEEDKLISEIVEKKFTSDEMLTFKVLERMQEKLGIIVRSDKDVYLEALKKIDPELGAIQEQLLKLTPKRDFQQLVKKQNALIKERYGEKLILNAKVEAQVREIRLQELNGGI